MVACDYAAQPRVRRRVVGSGGLSLIAAGEIENIE